MADKQTNGQASRQTSANRQTVGRQESRRKFGKRTDSNYRGIKLSGCDFDVVIILAYTISFLLLNFIRTVKLANLKINTG
jgi:hypothetical protein